MRVVYMHSYAPEPILITQNSVSDRKVGPTRGSLLSPWIPLKEGRSSLISP